MFLIAYFAQYLQEILPEELSGFYGQMIKESRYLFQF